MEDTIFLFFLLLKSNITSTHLFIILPYCGPILSFNLKFLFRLWNPSAQLDIFYDILPIDARPVFVFFSHFLPNRAATTRVPHAYDHCFRVVV